MFSFGSWGPGMTPTKNTFFALTIQSLVNSSSTPCKELLPCKMLKPVHIQHESIVCGCCKEWIPIHILPFFPNLSIKYVCQKFNRNISSPPHFTFCLKIRRLRKLLEIFYNAVIAINWSFWKMARFPPSHPRKRRNRIRGGQNDSVADSSLLNESNSSSFFPSNLSRGRTESVPTLNVSATLTPPASVKLERDRTPNLPEGCIWIPGKKVDVSQPKLRRKINSIIIIQHLNF